MIFCPQCNACPDYVFRDGKDCMVCPDCQTTSDIPDLTVIHKKASANWSTPTNPGCGIYPMIRNFVCKTKDCCGECVVVRNGFVVDHICSHCGKSDKAPTTDTANTPDTADTNSATDTTTTEESLAEPSPEPPKKSRTTKKKSKTD